MISRRITLSALLLGLAACQTATGQPPDDAPVAWDTALGRVVFAEEEGGKGVFEYPVPFGDTVGRFYVQDLSGESGGLGPYQGYWSEPDVSHDDENDDTLICPFVITDDHGRTTRNWGRLVLTFLSDFHPADFVLMRGRCFEEPRDVVAGKLTR